MLQWLNKALQIEEQSWLKGTKADLLHSYSYSPLASDIIELIDSSLKRLKCLGTDQSGQRVTAHLDGFFNRYLQAVEDFVKGNHSNMTAVLKAQLACEEQFREFVLNREISELKRQRCLDSLNAVRDCGYCSLTSGIRSQLKERLSGLWTHKWMDGSVPLIDALLDTLDQQLQQLHNLKSSCRQWLLALLHRDVALRYVKNLLKTRRRSQAEQVGGANRMKDDVIKMQTFFTQQGGCGYERVTQILLHVTEILRLQDPDSVQLELVTLVHYCPDLSAAHVSKLLLLKGGLTGGAIRHIRRSVEENRPRDASANHSPAFFSKLRVKWIKNKMSQLELNGFRVC